MYWDSKRINYGYKYMYVYYVLWSDYATLWNMIAF